MIRDAISRRLRRPPVALLVLWVAVSLCVAGGHGHGLAGQPTEGGSLQAETRAQTPRAPCLTCQLNRLTAPLVEGVESLDLIVADAPPTCASARDPLSSAPRPSAPPRAPPLVSAPRA